MITNENQGGLAAREKGELAAREKGELAAREKRGRPPRRLVSRREGRARWG